MENKAIIYFTNDEESIIDAEMENATYDPITYFDSANLTPDETVRVVINYLKAHTMEDPNVDKEVRRIIRSMDTMLAFDTDEEIEKYEKLLKTIPDKSKCFHEVLENYKDKLWTNPWFLQEQLDEDRFAATEDLKYDGFGDDMYIILGSNMGWRHRSGYKIAYLEGEEDMENAVTGNYAYTFELSRPNMEAPYLEASVSSHDSPLGESYMLIPYSRLKEALKCPEVKKEYDKYSDWIELDLEKTC